MERIASNFLERFGEPDIFQGFTSPKGIRFDLRNFLRNHNGAKCFVEGEGIVSNGCNTRRQDNLILSAIVSSQRIQNVDFAIAFGNLPAPKL